MPRAPFLYALTLLMAASPLDDEPGTGRACKDELSLTARFDKAVFRPSDPIELRFTLRNESDAPIYIADGFLSPDYHEAGPGRHFELEVTAGDDRHLKFWSGMSSEGTALAERRVFKLEPNGVYNGTIRLSAGAALDADAANQPHALRGGSFEEADTGQTHVLGKDEQKYRVAVRYRVEDHDHPPLNPPAGFRNDLLWTGTMTTTPVVFAIAEN
jgi:hypothetical protein